MSPYWLRSFSSDREVTYFRDELLAVRALLDEDAPLPDNVPRWLAGAVIVTVLLVCAILAGAGA